MKPNGFYIVKVTKKSINLDLWFKTQERANEVLYSDLYTDNQRKTRLIVPAYENGSYIELDGKLIRVELA